VFGLVSAHFKLLSAELSEIMGHVKRAAALAGIAFAFLLFAGILFFVGTILWFDEWVFGSIGWGVLHGGFGLIAIAVLALLLIIPNAGPRIGLSVFVALVVAVVVGLVLRLLTVSWAISIALAIFVFELVAPILAAILVLRAADFGELKNRFIPTQTIETTKETIEWVREQMPLGRKS